MPRGHPKLAVEGRVRSEAEYIEWAARVSSEAEDIRESVTEERWRAHVMDKYQFSWDATRRESQLTALWEKGIRKQWEEMPEVGILASTRYTPRGYYFQYRDIATGRFTSFAVVSEKLRGLY